ncbi:putative Ig domain-containing protein [Agromyces aerolatus]|uniref:putative Ig domain-containing protein n=1 Tax=Agromyces sp. LY-1074 TaxID=3074080 RepID=UPI00286300A2|nr:MULTISPECIES: putative Ig domain-containing protein [unclassified Agromyces]MDR5698551.1 putative Ig domain-containing protein [Agromyces sp. LY-1074]MDR5704845.1 putative Ig domain-containing protein [Agromyces sp. LY-1358]
MHPPAPTQTPRRFIRSLAAALAALLAATALALTPTSPANAATPPLTTVNYIIGNGQGQVVIADEAFADSEVTGTPNLPPGLSFDPSYGGIALTGVPGLAGVFGFSMRVQETPDGAYTDYDVAIRVHDTPVWQTTDLPTGTIDTPYDADLVVSPFGNFAVHSGTLPDGLELSRSGKLSGTPTVDGTFRFTVRATNLNGTADQGFALYIAPPTPAPVWQTTSLGNMRAAEWVSHTLQASDATEYSVVAGGLPSGLTLADGVISGVPTVGSNNGPYRYEFTVAASGPGGVTNQTFSGSVTAPWVTWMTGTITPAVIGVPYEFQLEARYANEYALHDGTMPPGLTVEPDGRIIGTPTQAGTSEVWLSAVNVGASSYRLYELVVHPAAPVWQTTGLGFTRVDVPLTTQLEATDATGFRVTAGALPAGLELVDGTVTGTPTEHGAYDVTIAAVNGGGETAQRFTGTVAAGAVVWVTERIGPFTVGVPVDLRLEATHAVDFRMNGAPLPDGLTLERDGRIHGTPTTVMSVSTGIDAFNADGAFGGGGLMKPVTVEVIDAATWAGETEFTIKDDERFDVPESAVEGGWITSATVTPALILTTEMWTPGILTFHPITPGTATVTVTYTNGADEWTQDVTVVVVERVVWVTESFGDLRLDVPFELELEATDATEFEITGGELPEGLTFEDGVIAGTPTEHGPYAVTIAASDGYVAVERQFTGTVAAGYVQWVTPGIPDATVGYPVDLQLEATHAVEYELEFGRLPDGLTLEPDGRLHGTPTQVGGSYAYIRGVNADGEYVMRQFSIVVRAAATWVGETSYDLAPGDELNIERATVFGWLTDATVAPDGIVDAEVLADTSLQLDALVSGIATVTVTFTNGVHEWTQDLTVTVAARKVEWVTADVGPFVVGDDVDVQLEATNAVEYVQWGAGVPGLTLDSDGRLHGAVTQVGTHSLSVEARNADGIGSTKGFLVTVRAIPVWVAQTSYTVTAGEFIELPNTSVTGGSMKGATVAPESVATAELRGRFGVRLTGVEAGTATVTVTLTNSSRDYEQAIELEVLPRPTWVTTSLGDLRVGAPYELALDASGATSFEITDGELPAGLTLAEGVIAGTPEAYGPYDVTIAASNGDIRLERRFTGAVADGAVNWVTEFFGPLEVGMVVDDAFDADYAASFTLESGALPTGLTLDADGRVHGTVTEAGRFEPSIRAANADGEGRTRTFQIDVRDVPVWTGETSFLMTTGNGLLIPETVAHGRVRDVVAANEEILDVSWAFGEGIEFVALDPGTTTVTVTMWNGVAEHTVDLTIEVRDAPVWQITEFGELREGVPFSVRLDATDATGYAVTDGELPAGLILDDGVIVGVPAAFGPYDVTITASNGDIGVEQRFTGVVSAPLVEWVTEAFPALDRNVAAELPLDAANAVEFELTGGGLPAGLAPVQADDGTWALAGTPTDAGTFAFELTARNATRDPAPRAFELVVAQPELSLTFAGEPGDEAAGVEIAADGSGLAPSSSWSVVVHSEPIVLASGEASVDGTVAASATLPATMPFGAHELRFTATGADGVEATTSVWFSVGEDGRIVEVSTTGPVADPPRVPAPTPAPASSGQSGAEIAHTGVEASAWLGGALALMLAGFAGLALTFRRRTARG